MSSSIDPSIVSAVIEHERRVALQLGQPEVRPERRDDGADQVGQDVLGVVELDIGEVAGVPGDVGDQEAGRLRACGHGPFAPQARPARAASLRPGLDIERRRPEAPPSLIDGVPVAASGGDAPQPDLVVAHDDHGVDVRGVGVVAVGDRADLVDLAGPELRAPELTGRPVVPGSAPS